MISTENLAPIEELKHDIRLFEKKGLQVISYEVREHFIFYTAWTGFKVYPEEECVEEEQGDFLRKNYPALYDRHYHGKIKSKRFAFNKGGGSLFEVCLKLEKVRAKND